MKLIAFYLPQFHSFPENDAWWGKGFTEWTNTKKAVPLYKNHYQPRTPLDNNYYCLLEKSTFEWQISLAKKYGIYGFCFYHYWFGQDHILMEKPIEMFLKNKDLNINFCISWANETWSRRWNGSDEDVLIKQDYGDEDTWKRHFLYLYDFFVDERYICVDGKPLFVLYKPEIFPDYRKMFRLWDKMAKERGLKGLTFAVQGAIWNNIENVDDSDVDYRIMYEPGYTTSQSSRKKGLRLWISTKAYSAYSKLNPRIRVSWQPYKAICKNIIRRRDKSQKVIPGFYVNWDNTPRKGKNGFSFVGSTPRVYKKYLSLLIRKTRYYNMKDMIFINAWNEWAEGCYLEPDSRYRYGYLKATKKALEDNNEFPNDEMEKNV